MPVLMSMTDIAELAGVRRPVVTTWRRRHDSFPAAVDGRGPQPLFDGREVCDWLVTTGRAERHHIEPDLHVHALSAFTEQLSPRDLIAGVTALICLHHLDDEPLARPGRAELLERCHDVDPDDRFLMSEIAGLTDDGVDLPAMVDELIEAAWGCGIAFDRIMDARARLGVRELAEVAVDPALARLMAALSGAPERAAHSVSLVLADPAAGAGDLLTALVRALPESCAPVAQAADHDPYLVRLLRRRLTVLGIPPDDLDVGLAQERATEADEFPAATVTQLPFQPAERRLATDVLAQINNIRSRLARGRVAVILGPADVLAGPLPRFSPAERARSELLASGAVTAVLRLPGGLVPFRPGYDTALWVLTAGLPSRGRVLLADLSDQPLNAVVTDGLVTDVSTWRRPGSHTTRICQPVEVATVVKSGSPLITPRSMTIRERATEVPATVARVAELERMLAELASTCRPAVRTGLAQALPAPTRRTSVGDLLRDGTLRLLPGVRVAPGDVCDHGQHRVLGVPELVGHERSGHRHIDRAVLAQRYPRAALTEPGDVLVTTSPAPGTLVDDSGFAVVEFPVRALRIAAHRRHQLTPHLLATLLRAAAATRSDRAVRAPKRLHDWEIPVLDARLVRAADTIFTQLDARRTLAERELAALTELDRIAATGLTNATLTIRTEQEM